MDLNKVNDEEKLNLCRRYFYIGIFFLPFLWLINVIWFLPHAYKRRSFTQQQSIRHYVILSLIGVLIWSIIGITWITVFQLKRADWGLFGDYISFNIPRGIP